MVEVGVMVGQYSSPSPMDVVKKDGALQHQSRMVKTKARGARGPVESFGSWP